MKLKMLLVLLLTTLFNYAEVSDSIKHLLFIKGMLSGGGHYVVINLKNTNNGETREVCISAGLLSPLLKKESKCTVNTLFEKKFILDNKNRNFEFNDESLLKSLGFYLYSKKEYDDFVDTLNHEETINRAIQNDQTLINKMMNSKQRNMALHFLFNNGILIYHRFEPKGFLYSTIPICDTSLVRYNRLWKTYQILNHNFSLSDYFEFNLIPDYYINDSIINYYFHHLQKLLSKKNRLFKYQPLFYTDAKKRGYELFEMDNYKDICVFVRNKKKPEKNIYLLFDGYYIKSFIPIIDENRKVTWLTPVPPITPSKP